MCLNPISVPNPYYGLSANKSLSNPRLVSNKPTIEVPCRRCSECFANFRNHFIQRCTFEALTSHVFMVTLTYDDDHMPTAVLSDEEGNGSSFAYSDYTHFQNLVKRMRNNGLPGGRSFRYFSVTEYGDRHHRPHFHALFFVSRLESDTPEDVQYLSTFMYDTIRKYWSVNIGTKRSPVYESLYTHKEYVLPNGVRKCNYDCHLVLPLTRDTEGNLVQNTDLNYYLTHDTDVSAVARYVSSYIQKQDSYITSMLSKLRRFTVKLPSGEYLPNEHFHRFSSLFSTIRIASKGLGFGFDPRTGKKVYVRSSKVASEFATYKDELVSELYSEYQSLPSNTELDCLRYHRLSAANTNFAATDFSVAGYPLHKITTLLLSFSSSFRSEYRKIYPNEIIPPKFQVTSRLDDVYESLTSILCPSLDSFETPTLSAISKFLKDAVNSEAATPRAALPGGFVSGVSPYYRRFISDEDLLLFYDRHNYLDFDDYISKVPEPDRSRTNFTESLYNKFLMTSNISSSVMNRTNYFIDSISIDQLAPLVTIDQNLYKGYLRKVNTYNQSFI